MTKHQKATPRRVHPTQAPSAPASDKGQETAFFLRKRIGSTNYRVRVHFSSESQETVNDKITRLIRREAAEL